MKVIVENTIVEADKIAARCHVAGPHAGQGIRVAPTDRRVEFTGMVMVRVKDEKIVEAWDQFDFMKMYGQVGALTPNFQ